jgi:outer membrane biosynthesis protein TonB
MSVALNPGVSPIFVSPLTGDTNVPPVGNDPGWKLSGTVDPNLILACQAIEGVVPELDPAIAAQHQHQNPIHPPTPPPHETEEEKKKREEKEKEKKEKEEPKKEHHSLFGRKHGD